MLVASNKAATVCESAECAAIRHPQTPVCSQLRVGRVSRTVLVTGAYSELREAVSSESRRRSLADEVDFSGLTTSAIRPSWANAETGSDQPRVFQIELLSPDQSRARVAAGGLARRRFDMSTFTGFAKAICSSR